MHTQLIFKITSIALLRGQSLQKEVDKDLLDYESQKLNKNIGCMGGWMDRYINMRIDHGWLGR